MAVKQILITFCHEYPQYRLVGSSVGIGGFVGCLVGSFDGYTYYMIQTKRVSEKPNNDTDKERVSEKTMITISKYINQIKRHVSKT